MKRLSLSLTLTLLYLCAVARAVNVPFPINPAMTPEQFTNMIKSIAGSVATPAISNIIYVSASGSDANSGFDINHPLLTPSAACAIATNGQTILLGFGIFNLGTNILVPNIGVSIVGMGKGNTVLLGYADCAGVEEGYAATGGPQISLCDNVYLGHFDLVCDTNSLVPLSSAAGPHSGTWSGIGVSRYNPPSNRNFTNVLVEDVGISRGYFDGFHFNNDSNCTFVARNCSVDLNGGDCVNAVLADETNPDGGQTNSTYSFYDCTFKTTNDAVYNAFVAAGIVTGDKAIVHHRIQNVRLVNCQGSSSGKLVGSAAFPAVQVFGGEYLVRDTKDTTAAVGNFSINRIDSMVESNVRVLGQSGFSDRAFFTNALVVLSNTFPITANFANLKNSGSCLWNSNGVLWAIGTNSLTGTAWTNKLGGP